MEIGQKIVIEINKRGLKGYFFTKQQYQELKTAVDLNDAKEKISKFGYPSVNVANNIEEIINVLKFEAKVEDRERNGCFTYAALEIAFWFILSLLTCS